MKPNVFVEINSAESFRPEASQHQNFIPTEKEIAFEREIEADVRLAHELQKRTIFDSRECCWYWTDNCPDEDEQLHGPFDSYLLCIQNIVEPYKEMQRASRAALNS